MQQVNSLYVLTLKQRYWAEGEVLDPKLVSSAGSQSILPLGESLGYQWYWMVALCDSQPR